MNDNSFLFYKNDIGIYAELGTFQNNHQLKAVLVANDIPSSNNVHRRFLTESMTGFLAPGEPKKAITFFKQLLRSLQFGSNWKHC